MANLNSDSNIVEALRSSLEQSDIKQYLKGTIGGYTRRSVLEYLSVIRKQQQSLADTFTQAQLTLLEQKEDLKKTNEALKAQLGQVESEFKDLVDTIRVYELDSEEISLSQIIALKRAYAELEDELSRSRAESGTQAKQIEHQKLSIDELREKLEKSEQEKLSMKEIIIAQTQKLNSQGSLIAELSGTIDQKEEEINFLNSLVSESRVAELTKKVNELTEQLFSQAEILAGLNSDNNLKAKAMENLEHENSSLRQRCGVSLKELDEAYHQIDKYMAANKELSAQLESEFRKSISLIQAKSNAAIEKFAAMKKLDEANSKIVMLELQLSRQKASEPSGTNDCAKPTQEIQEAC